MVLWGKRLTPKHKQKCKDFILSGGYLKRKAIGNDYYNEQTKQNKNDKEDASVSFMILKSFQLT